MTKFPCMNQAIWLQLKKRAGLYDNLKRVVIFQHEDCAGCRAYLEGEENKLRFHAKAAHATLEWMDNLAHIDRPWKKFDEAEVEAFFFPLADHPIQLTEEMCADALCEVPNPASLVGPPAPPSTRRLKLKSNYAEHSTAQMNLKV
jgi:hypothetical protein